MVGTSSSKQWELAALAVSKIHGKTEEIMDEYKYLGTIFNNTLKFPSNTENIPRRSQQRQYLLRKLNSFEVNRNILKTFYHSFVESVIAFSITCWFHSISLHNRTRLQSTVKVCSNIIGLLVRSLSTMCEQQTLRTASRILQDPSHVMFSKHPHSTHTHTCISPCSQSSPTVGYFITMLLYLFIYSFIYLQRQSTDNSICTLCKYCQNISFIYCMFIIIFLLSVALSRRYSD